MARPSRPERFAIAVILGTLALTGVLLAQGLGQLTAASLLPLDPSALTPPPPTDVRLPPRERTDPTAILERNMFDHEVGNLLAVEIDTTGLCEGDDCDDEVAEPVEDWECGTRPPPDACEGSMRLVGTFVRRRAPARSFATITNSTGIGYLYEVGMEVDRREIQCVERNLVVLRNEDSQGHCSLRMFAEEGPVARATVAPPPSTRRTGPAARPDPSGLSPEELESGISRVSDNEFTVQRSLVDRLLANQAALMRTARVIPHEEDGQVVGVKLYGIRRSSLLGRLGVQNGDMLRTINGYDMSSPDSALEAYARLRQADRITLNVVRRGSPMTIDYSIR